MLLTVILNCKLSEFPCFFYRFQTMSATTFDARVHADDTMNQTDENI